VCKGNEQPSKVSLDSASFWVHLCGLPFNSKDVDIVYSNVSKIGRVLDIDPGDYG